MLSIYKFVLIFLIYCLPLLAGNEVGNGGDAVVCPNKNPILLDFYEVNSSQYILREFKQEKSREQILMEVVNQLKEIAPALHRKYSRTIRSLTSKIVMIKGKNFRDIKDSFHVGITKECSLQQLAMQKKDFNSKILKYYLNEDIFKKLNPVNQAGLIFHEIIYEHFRYFGKGSSVTVRSFNRYLFSKKILKATKISFNKKVQSLGVPSY